MRKTPEINHSAIRTGDVIGTEDTLHPMSMTTRVTCGGASALFSTRISTHIVVACESHGLMYGMEMGPRKIRMVDLREYENGRFGNHIVFVGRHVDMTPDKAFMAWSWLHDAHAKSIKYDHVELLKFLNLPVTDDPDRLICSGLPRELFRAQRLRYDPAFDVKVSPLNWQRSACLRHIHWWK